ncbi:CAP domain-containing protein [Massilia endophytica]|uniref:CAP domain-containing protein n=1 Tax=Massilia endophytica TaxID=2899220 RepID=UPI001E5CEC1A|nr:CAP domain-containing protein [Massilia endophytica]UGQ46664.1 CAP domain-containing protein [Massilia endophytica]
MRSSDTRHIRFLALLLAALLSACGGGGGSSNSGGVTPPPTNPPPTPSAPGAPAATGNTATDGFNWFNFRRSQIGLATLARNAQMDLASQGHANYLMTNNTVSHTQVAGNPGFTGANLIDRFNAAGYRVTAPYAYGEVISAAGDRAGFYHAEELIAAIYHRFVIFEPVFKEAGTGAATSNSNYTYFTAAMAASGGYGAGVARGTVAVYPGVDQTAVPVNFMSDSEAPDPVPNQNEVGYPISVHANIASTIAVTSFTVKPRGGSNLAARLLTKSTDSNTPASAAAIIPLAKLNAATTYDVSFAGSVDGAAVTRNWSFTTK